MVYIDYEYDDGYVISCCATNILKTYSLRRNGKRPVSAYIYSLGSDELTLVQVKRLVEYTAKFASKTLHPMEGTIDFDEEVLKLDPYFPFMKGYYSGIKVGEEREVYRRKPIEDC